MKLLYDGLLTAQVAEYVKGAARDYGHVVELSRVPPDWGPWSESHLTDYPSVGEDCMGRAYTRTTKKYVLVTNTEESVFLFLKSRAEKMAVMVEFPEWLVNQNPFRTLVD